MWELIQVRATAAAVAVAAAAALSGAHAHVAARDRIVADQLRLVNHVVVPARRVGRLGRRAAASHHSLNAVFFGYSTLSKCFSLAPALHAHDAERAAQHSARALSLAHPADVEADVEAAAAGLATALAWRFSSAFWS